MLILIECVLDFVVLDLFLVVGCPLQAYQFFVIAHKQVSGFVTLVQASVF